MHQKAFHRDFRLALAGRRMAGNVEGRLDDERINRLLTTWRQDGRARFLVWSGYWLPVLERYAACVPDTRVELDFCRIDAVESDSFRIHHEPAGIVRRELWLWNWRQRSLGRRLPLPAGAPLPFDARTRRLVAHGGGWGLGTYAEVLTELSLAGYALDVLGPDPPDWDGRGPLDRCYVSDPDWHPWVRNAAGDLTFPPLGEVRPNGEIRYRSQLGFPAAHMNVREAMAVVSKPGGGTLLDSLAAATPIVLLTPWGQPEAKNGALWEELGFGIDYPALARDGLRSRRARGSPSQPARGPRARHRSTRSGGRRVTTTELRPVSGGPSWLVIQLLERCNLRCNMCYEWGESGAYQVVAEPG